MRANVVAECTLKESAAINQILGRRVSFGAFCLSLLTRRLLYKTVPTVLLTLPYSQMTVLLLGNL